MSEKDKATDDALVALRCRDDILQAMYWLRGEGFGEDSDVASLASFLVLDEELLRQQLAMLVVDGLLEESRGRYRLSEAGVREGGRRFADEFADLQKTAHGECGPDCPICKDTPRDRCAHCSPEAREPSSVGW